MPSDPEATHHETAAGWDVVAREKYEAEREAHLELLRAGGTNLLEVEARLLAPLLPGARVVQLQCSHGLDALGLLNAGAARVVGVDISPEMIRQAREKAEALGADAAAFVRADAIRAPAKLDGTADLVYTGRGSLPWILDLETWAASAARILRPGGNLFLLEGHPLTYLWRRDAQGLELRPDASYFDPRAEEQEGFPASVVRGAMGEEGPALRERRWRPGQVVNALIGAGLEIRHLAEHPELYWDQFPEWPEALRRRVPNSYTVMARRPE